MGSLRLLALVLLLGATVAAQSPKYGIGTTPTAEQLRAADISIGPTGTELPPGRGTVKEGAQLYRSKGCAGCHGATGMDGRAPALKAKAGPETELWRRGRILPLRAPHATIVWDYINRAMRPSKLARHTGAMPRAVGLAPPHRRMCTWRARWTSDW